VRTDDDGVSDRPMTVELRVVLDGKRILVDFTGSDPQHASRMNMVYPHAFAAVAFPFKCLLPEDIPGNDGFYRVLEVIAPEGSVVNCSFPGATSIGAELGQKIVEGILRALAPALPERVPAMGKGTNSGVGFGSSDLVTGAPFAFHEALGGGAGALFDRDGTDAVQIGFGNTENVAVEEVESKFQVIRHELWADSGGPGRRRGGLGIRKDYRVLQESSFSCTLDSSRFPPQGIFGGLDGRGSEAILNPGGPDEQRLPNKGSATLPAGSLVSVRTPGGGGYGDPDERSPEALEHDLQAGKVTPAAATNIYRRVGR
jgi:N-methylhydantoinase B